MCHSNFAWEVGRVEGVTLGLLSGRLVPIVKYSKSESCAPKRPERCSLS